MSQSKVMFNHLNTAPNLPHTGDILVIETKRNKGVKVMVQVKSVIDHGNGIDGVEIIIQKGRNKYFNWGMYLDGTGWVWRVWNLGQIKLTSGLNNTNLIDNM